MPGHVKARPHTIPSSGAFGERLGVGEAHEGLEISVEAGQSRCVLTWYGGKR